MTNDIFRNEYSKWNGHLIAEISWRFYGRRKQKCVGITTFTKTTVDIDPIIFSGSCLKQASTWL